MKIYAFKNKYEQLFCSSSGGAFIAIVDTLNKLGRSDNLLIYGATYDEQLNVVHRAATIDRVEQFQGSKYVQSNIGTVYQDIEQQLNTGKLILFTGTPCQVYALKVYLEKRDVDISNLYLVDIICHGTPNAKLWTDYRIWLEKKHNSKIRKFSFRYKGEPDNQRHRMSYPTMVEFENGKRFEDTFDSRVFTNLFFTHLAMREACYSCKFSNINRHSDLTIGDFWGIEKVMPDINASHGVSEILVNTIKGERILRLIEQMTLQDSRLLLRECLSSDYLKYQYNLNRPTNRPELTDRFREDYINHGFEFLIKKYAGYNFNGKIKFVCNKILTITGLMPVVKSYLHK